MICSIRSACFSEVLEVEKNSFPEPWSQAVFCTILSDPRNKGYAFKVDGVVRGFVIFRVTKKRLLIGNIAVDPKYRRSKIATFLMHKVISKLSGERTKICATVSEKNLESHLFLKSCGFNAVKVLRNFFKEDDAYDFVFNQSSFVVTESSK